MSNLIDIHVKISRLCIKYKISIEYIKTIGKYIVLIYEQDEDEPNSEPYMWFSTLNISEILDISIDELDKCFNANHPYYNNIEDAKKVADYYYNRLLKIYLK